MSELFMSRTMYGCETGCEGVILVDGDDEEIGGFKFDSPRAGESLTEAARRIWPDKVPTGVEVKAGAWDPR